MLKRNLIYTAITRGKKKVVMVGQKKAFLNGLQILVKRNTNLNLKKVLNTLWFFYNGLKFYYGIE